MPGICWQYTKGAVNVKRTVLVLAALASLALVIIGLVSILLPSPITFCEHVAILGAAVDAGDAVLDAVEAFLEAEPAALIADLPESAHLAARALVVAAQTVVKGVGLLSRSLPLQMLEPLINAIRTMDTACAALPAR